jgi:hypothetical protein
MQFSRCDSDYDDVIRDGREMGQRARFELDINIGGGSAPAFSFKIAKTVLNTDSPPTAQVAGRGLIIDGRDADVCGPRTVKGAM